MDKNFKVGSANSFSFLTDFISGLQWDRSFSDVEFHCSDGIVRAHAAVLSSMSPFLKALLSDRGDEAVIYVPEANCDKLHSLMSLLYTGTVNLLKSEIQGLVDLTQVLKLVSIPVLLEEHSWTHRFPNKPTNYGVGEKSKFAVLKPPKRTRKREAPTDRLKSVPILSTKRTRSGRVVVHKKYDEDLIVGDISAEKENDDNVAVGDANGPLTSTTVIQVVPTIPKANVGVDAEDSKANNEAQFADLLSVAEAFERSQQPDANDISNPAVVEETSTKTLMRKCVLCAKQVLGRNALGRHMKKCHPAVFGPYKCPAANCEKTLESGEKVVRHMYVHAGRRGQALAQGKKFPCNQENCQSVFTTETRLTEHMKKRHGMWTGEAKFPCNASVDVADAKCPEAFATATAFIDHMRGVHKLKPWICLRCPGHKRFQERQNFNYHMMTHDGKRGYECDICRKGFTNPRQLYTHRALHLGKRFLCTHCGFRARSNANLRGHIRTKHEAKNFECGYCSKKFATNNNLKNHVRIHTGETPYECELCSVKFKRVHHLYSHVESKVHMDVLDKCRANGVAIPDKLDPVKRLRGRVHVEEGPVTCHLANTNSDNTNDVKVNEAFDGEVVVIEEQADIGTYVIPLDATSVELVQ